MRCVCGETVRLAIHEAPDELLGEARVCGVVAGTGHRAGSLSRHQAKWGARMSTTTILIIVLLLLLVGALPAWPYSSGWGYYPSGGLGLVLLIVVVLLLMGRI